MEKFSEACVIASTHTVVLVQNAHEAGHLPRRNPFVIYFLFAAALILMSNEFALLYVNSAADQCIRNAMAVMAYSAESDPQARRLLYILREFGEVIRGQRDRRERERVGSGVQLPPFGNMKGGVNVNVNPYGVPQGSTIEDASDNGNGMTLPSVANATYGLAPITSMRQNPSPLNGLNLPNPSPSFPPTPSSFPSLLHSTTRPLEPSLTSPAPPNPLSPHPSGMQTPTLGSLERQLSFSNIFDLSHLTGDGMSVSGDSNGPGEEIDFDALWAWGGNGTPALGTPKLGNAGMAGMVGVGVG